MSLKVVECWKDDLITNFFCLYSGLGDDYQVEVEAESRKLKKTLLTRLPSCWMMTRRVPSCWKDDLRNIQLIRQSRKIKTEDIACT